MKSNNNISMGDSRLQLTILFLLFIAQVHAQTYVSSPMTGTPAAGTYYNESSITVTDGFLFTASQGQTLILLIQPRTDCTSLAVNPTQSQNYILTSTPRLGGITSVAGLTGQSTCQLMQTIQYYDGLGRPLQTVQVQGSAQGRDVVQPFVYDQFGREATKYLPYALTGSAVSDGSYKTTALTDQPAFYNTPPAGVTQMSTPVAGTAFEPSPLNRVIEQGAPGADWQLGQHTVKMIYASNDATSLSSGTGRWARLYTVAIDPSTGVRTLVDNGSAGYAVNQLYVTISQNENWSTSQIDPRLNTTEEYKDKEGHVILKRTYNYNTPTSAMELLSTYYVYDDFGDLCYVLPPMSNPDNGLSSASNQTTLTDLCYQYTYDERGRMVSKQLPGKGIEETVYNLIDQPVYTRDANQAGRQEWAFAKYDALGRVIMTGIETSNNNTRTALQSNVTAALTAGTAAQWETPAPGSGVQGYSNTAYPNSASMIPLSVNYYDDYSFQGQPAGFAAPSGYSVMTKGLLTATKTAVLNTMYSATPDMLWTAHYYDDFGRATQSYSQHYLGGVLSPYNYDLVTNSFDFTNEVTAATRQHFTANANNTAATLKVTIANTYVYDHVGRKKQTLESINNGTNVMLSQNDYNEAGQAMTKHLHSTDNGSTFTQDIAFAYNERGWLLNNSASLFTEQLQYNSNPLNVTSFVPQWNGNIASQTRMSAGIANTTYVYAYDNLNRLTAGTSTDNFNESGISYDLAGNIKALQRTLNGTTPIDNLSYTYTDNSGNYTNQVQSITDASPDVSGKGYPTGTFSYQYDSNGNMKQDNSKALTIGTYNVLNLPQNLTLNSAAITYTYDATGRKLRKVSTAGGGSNTDYIDGIEYDAGVLNFIQTEEGRALYNSGNINYEYNLTDHLGNVRLTFDTHISTPTVTQQDDYYSFGYEISRGTTTSPKNEYLYNKKELQEDLGQYDYGARFYDPVTARWGVTDPFAEKYPSLTPYAYVANSPINLTDIDGRDWEWNWKRDKKGNINGLDLVLNGKILDRTGSYSAKQLEMLKNDYVKGIQGMLKGSFGKDFSITTTANLSVVSSMSDVKSTDHLINIISNDAMAKSQGKNVNGVGEMGGLNIWMTQRSVDETLKTGSAREISHELGHTGGLPHPDDQGKNAIVYLPNSGYDNGPNANNFMWGSQVQLTNFYGMNPMNNSQPAVNFGANTTYVDPNQLWSGIFSNLINHKINQQYGRPAVPPKDNTSN